MHEVYARLKILSKTLTSEQIGATIGIKCDKEWKIGDRRGKSSIIEKENGWIVQSSLPASDDLEAHIQALLERIEPDSDAIASLKQTCTIEFSCVVYSKDTPALYFDNKVVTAISRLGASFDIDLYLGSE